MAVPFSIKLRLRSLQATTLSVASPLAALVLTPLSGMLRAASLKIAYDAGIGGVAPTPTPTPVPTPTPTPTPGAITSPTAFAQPGTTRKFYQVTANQEVTSVAARSGANSGNVLTAGTDLFSVSDAALTDGTSAATRVLPLAVTLKDGTILNYDVTVTMQTIELPSALSQSVSKSYAGAAGTTLASLSGWTLYGSGATNQYATDGNGALVKLSGGQDQKFTAFTAPFALAGAERSISIVPRETTGADITAVPVFGKDAANWLAILVSINPYDATSAQTKTADINFQMAYMKAGAMMYYVNPTTSPTPAFNRGPARINTRGAEHTITFRFSADGTLLTIVPSWNPTAVTTFTIDPAIMGSLAGYGHDGFGNGPIDALGRITQDTVLKADGTLSITGFVRPFSTGPSLTAKLASTGTAPTRARHRTRPRGSTGAFSPWMVGELATVSGELQYTLTSSETDPEVQIQKYNDTPAFAAASGLILNNKLAIPARWGYNTASTYYYQNNAISSNFGRYAIIGDGTSNSNIGLPPLAPGRYDLIMGAAGRGVTIPNGSGFSIVSGSASTGVYVVDYSSSGNANLTWTGSVPANLVVRKQGVTVAINPDMVVAHDSDGIRSLDLQQSNQEKPLSVCNSMDQRITPSDPLPDQNNATGFYFPKGETTLDIALACNALKAARPTFTALYYTVPVDLTSAGQTEAFTTLRDNLDPSITIMLEFGNENRGYSLHTGVGAGGNQQLVLRGFAAGFYGDGAQPGLTVTPLLGSNGFVNYVDGGSATNTVSPQAAAGSLWLLNIGGLGVSVIRAKTARTAGSSVNIDGTNWEVAYDVVACALAAERMHCHLNDLMVSNAESVFGASAATRLFPVAMTFGDTDLSRFATMKAFRPGLWAKVKGVGRNGYVYDLKQPDGSDTNFQATDFTEAKFDAAFRYSLPQTIAACRSFALAVLAEGRLPVFYEVAEQHGAGPDGGSAQYRATNLAYTRGSYALPLARDFAKAWRAAVPGWAFIYQGYGTPVWGHKKDILDLNAPRYLGFQQGRDA